MFIEDTFQLSESCMGIRRQDVLPPNAKIHAQLKRGDDGKFYFSATNENSTANGKTEADAVKHLTLGLLSLNSR
jgi:hypothetical protein